MYQSADRTRLKGERQQGGSGRRHERERGVRPVGGRLLRRCDAEHGPSGGGEVADRLACAGCRGGGKGRLSVVAAPTIL